MDPLTVLAECVCLEPDADSADLDARLRHLFPDDDLVAAAATIAAEAHARHRRAEGTPYIVHPLRVALTVARRGEPPELVAAALCHDVLEDAPRFAPGVYRLGPAVSDLVEILTEDWDEDYFARIASAGRAAAVVKLADRIDNVRFLHRVDSFKHARYLGETRREFPPIAAVAAAPDLADALWAIVAWQEQNPPRIG